MRVAFWGQRHLLPGDTVVCLCLLPGTYHTTNRTDRGVIRRAEEGGGHGQSLPEVRPKKRTLVGTINTANALLGTQLRRSDAR